MATRTISNSGGTRNWSDTASWVEAAVPTASDDVVATGTSGNLTNDVNAQVCRSLDFTGFTGTWAGSTTLSIGTSTAGPSNVALKMSSTMNMSYTGVISYVGTNATAQTLTSATKSFASGLTVNGALGTLRLADAYTNSNNITLTAGTFDFNGQTSSLGALIITNNSTVRVFAVGSAAISLSAGTPIQFGATTTNFSITGTGTITMTSSAATLATGGVNLAGTSITFSFGASGGNTYHITGAGTLFNVTWAGNANATSTMDIAANITVTGTLTLTGNNSSPNRIVVKSNTPGTSRTITAAVVSLTNVSFLDITGAGAATWSGTSVGTQANTTSGITGNFNAGRYAIVAGNWSSTSTWTNAPGGTGGAVVPTTNDDVFFQANTGSGTYTVDASATARSVDLTGSSGVTFTGSSTLSIGAVTRGQGDIALTIPATGVTWSYSGSLTFVGTNATAQGFTSGGHVLSHSITVNGAAGTLKLLDAVTATNITLANGTININGQAVALISVTISNNSNTRVFNMGTSASITLSSGSNAWNSAGTVTNFSVTGTGTIVLSNSTNFAGAGANYSGTSNGITVSMPGSGAYSITGANTFGSIIRNNGTSLAFPSATTTTITNNFTLNRTTFKASTPASAATISAGPSVTISVFGTYIQDSTATGGATFTALNSGNVSNNTGWTFSAGGAYTGWGISR